MLVAPRTRRVLAPNPSPMTGPGTNTYLVGSGQIAVVDPGPDDVDHVERVAHLSAAAGDRIVAILITHGHPDHLPAAYRLRERTGAPIMAHRQVRDADVTLAHDAEIEIGGLTVRAVETPGHSDDHLCFWIESSRLLFAGDLVAGAGTVVLAETPGALAQYLSSLQRVLGFGRLTLLPGHGPVVDDGQSKIQEYLDHRARRDRQIRDALRDGPRTVDALVEQLYVGTIPALYPMAARNVAAHLDRMRALGMVDVLSDTWYLVSPTAT